MKSLTASLLILLATLALTGIITLDTLDAAMTTLSNGRLW